MSDSQEQLWSDNPNAPNIPPTTYFAEKAYFAGILVSSVLYGIIIMLFLQCMAGLFNNEHRKGERIKWGLVSYTVVTFLIATVGTASILDYLSISYVDNREFPGIDMTPPGPFIYQLFTTPSAVSIIPNITFPLNNWLADGLLLYRCYVIYSKKLWVIAFPCLMYLGSFAMGISFVYQAVGPTGITWSGLPYYSISLSLNVLLTLMIVIRLIVHARSTRAALGMTGIGGLYKAVVTMLVESCAIFAVSSLLVIGTRSAIESCPIVNFFLPVLYQTQVIAPLLVIRRVANKDTLASNTVASVHFSLSEVGGQGESTGDSSTLPSRDAAFSVDRCGVVSGGLEVGTMHDFHRENSQWELAPLVKT